MLTLHASRLPTHIKARYGLCDLRLSPTARLVHAWCWQVLGATWAGKHTDARQACGLGQKAWERAWNDLKMYNYAELIPVTIKPGHLGGTEWRLWEVPRWISRSHDFWAPTTERLMYCLTCKRLEATKDGRCACGGLMIAPKSVLAKG